MNLFNSNISRKNFVVWMSGFAILITAIRFKLFTSKPKTSMKFLTEDGKLVEVDTKHLNKKGTKIYTSDIFSWIKNK